MLDADLQKSGEPVRYAYAEPASPAIGVSLRTILGIVMRRWWIVALVLGLALAAAIFAIKTLPRSYTASAQVMLENREINVVDITSVVSGIRLDPSAISSELTILQSYQLLSQVVRKLNLTSDPEFVDPAYAAEATDEKIERVAVKSLFDRMQAQQLGLSYVIEIDVTTRDAVLSALIANSIADQYIQGQLEAKYQATQRATNYLSGKVESLRIEVQRNELAVERFRAQQIAGDRQSPEAIERQITDLSTKLIEAQALYAASRARLEEAQRVVEAQGLFAASSLVGTPVMTALKTSLAELRRRLGDLSTRYGPKHPRIINLRGEIADSRSAIRSEVQKTVQSLRSEFAVAEARLATLKGSLETLEEQMSGQSEGSLELRELERVAEASRLTYETFLKRFTETNDATGIREADARVVSKALPPDDPSAPKKKLIVAGAGVVGLALGLALVLVIEFSVATFRTLEELEFQTGLPIIASVPSIPDGALKLGWFGRVLWQSELGQIRREQTRLLSFVSYFHRRPNSALAEAIRRIGVAIKLDKTEGAGARVVMVTSSVPSEGKSTLSSLLAKSAAARGEKVILVDCDLRSPSFAVDGAGAEASEQRSKDLVDVLRGDAPLDEAIAQDKRFECDLLYPRYGTPMAGDLINRARFKELIEELKGRYELIVLDAPPSVAVSDAVTIGRYSDVVVYAVRWGFAARSTVLRGVKELEAAGAQIHGLVFTLVDNIREAQLRDPAAARDVSRMRKYYNS
ncbi:MAG: polysaccharide biosynthesis tyrosine autokinase [Pseudomonadota bacterium]